MYSRNFKFILYINDDRNPNNKLNRTFENFFAKEKLRYIETYVSKVETVYMFSAVGQRRRQWRLSNSQNSLKNVPIHECARAPKPAGSIHAAHVQVRSNKVGEWSMGRELPVVGLQSLVAPATPGGRPLKNKIK